MLIRRLKNYALLMRLDKPIGILLLLWPTLWALWIASVGVPPLRYLGVFVLGAILTRSAGCIINDIADRNFDGHVQRTRQRPLAAGHVSLHEALLLFIVLCLLAGSLLFFLNLLAVKVAIAALLCTVIYPFTKRYTHFPQIMLGITFYLGVPMAFAAVGKQISALAWLLYATAIIWAICYDTMYAMVDREDDIQIGLKSTAILFARADRLIIAVLQVVFLSLLLSIGCLLHLSSYYFIAVGVAALLSAYQQYLLKDREPHACFKAFLNNNWLGLVIFIGIVLALRKL